MTAKTRATKKPAPPRVDDEHLAGAPPERERCSETTAKGTPCRNYALEGSAVCATHGGAAVGRPPKLTEPVTVRICEILRGGGYVETAAAVAGISKATYHDWIKRGDPSGTKKADEPYRDFRVRVEQARYEGEAILVARVATHAQKDWRAAAWMLERQNPERWAGPRGRAAVLGNPEDPPGGGAITDPDGAPVVVDDQLGPDGQPL